MRVPTAGKSHSRRSSVGPQPPVSPGLAHYLRQCDGQFRRFHLRVDDDGTGLLLADATSAVHLSPTAVTIVRGLLEGRDRAQVVAELAAQFPGAPTSLVETDVARVDDLFSQLLESGDRYPIVNLDDPSFLDAAAPLAKPVTADAVIAADTSHRELIDRLWEFGIPHVLFLPAAAAKQQDALRRNTVDAVCRAEDLGMIAGVRIAPGSAASDSSNPTTDNDAWIRDLAAAGLDHLNVPLLAADAGTHDNLFGPGSHAAALAALETARDAELCPLAEVPLFAGNTGAADTDVGNIDSLDATLDLIASRAIRNVAVYALASVPGSEPHGAVDAHSLLQLAAQIEDRAEELGIRFPLVAARPA